MSDPAVVNGRDHAIIGHTLSFSLNVPNLQVPWIVNGLNTSDQNQIREFFIQLLRCFQRRYLIQRA